jgi:pimeloyl-ACP methyl ester carboxylesterase
MARESSGRTPTALQPFVEFRRRHEVRLLDVDGEPWEYLAVGRDGPAVLFLHGMGGGADIWFQQIEALSAAARCIAVTYPPVTSLADLRRGIVAILDHEGVGRVTVIGSSLGGYLAQYLVAVDRPRIDAALFGNSFPPNDLIATRNATRIRLLPYLPSGLVVAVLRQNTRRRLVPAGDRSPLLEAYLVGRLSGRRTKADFLARYRCVVDPFEPPDVTGLPVLIVESDNDPLVPEELRSALRSTYPSARVHTFRDAGHFPYLNRPDDYTSLVRSLLG